MAESANNGRQGSQNEDADTETSLHRKTFVKCVQNAHIGPQSHFNVSMFGLKNNSVVRQPVRRTSGIQEQQ